VQTDGIRIGHSHINNFLNTGHQAFGSRISRIPHIKANVGEEDGVSITCIIGEAGPVVDGHRIEVVEPIGKETVIVDQHRVFFTFFIIPRFNQDPLDGPSIDGVPLHQFLGRIPELELRLTPGKLRGLRIYIGKFLRLFEFQIAHPQIRKLCIGLAGIKQLIGISGFSKQGIFLFFFNKGTYTCCTCLHGKQGSMLLQVVVGR